MKRAGLPERGEGRGAAPGGEPDPRYHVCCRECRRHGHRDGCTRCEDRTADTFGLPHPDDYPGREVR